MQTLQNTVAAAVSVASIGTQFQYQVVLALSVLWIVHRPSNSADAEPSSHFEYNCFYSSNPRGKRHGQSLYNVLLAPAWRVSREGTYIGLGTNETTDVHLGLRESTVSQLFLCRDVRLTSPSSQLYRVPLLV